ncbi:DDE-type integrase/transposase/recombinase [Pelagicoccus sp. SDUM812005]|uniref:Mu transposase C-terminal domain-containing protein n=1 Tax=Pelagicoccus sp. SDUM812005 TaxID=3041257 RepID=UPI00280F5AC3|nr:DDE-type integrase/transposase/recombinase [Pelagicoccus sp. SDUM812005]MDQ8180371.1 DDE-type integrase/transposase/recombinase [Pelagicoccus sp. SDUM812005]
MNLNHILSKISHLTPDRHYLERRIAEGPSRYPTDTGYGNRLTKFASDKMGRTVWCESDHEYETALALEVCPHVAAYWEQPPPVRVKRIDKLGRETSRDYITDFLAALNTGTQVAIETKPEEEIEKELKKQNSKFIKDHNGYRDPEAEASFAKMGIQHILVTREELGPALHENASRLKSYTKREAPNKALATKIAELVGSRGLVTQAEIIEELGKNDTLECTRWLVANGKFHSDVFSTSLDDIKNFRLYSSLCSEHTVPRAQRLKDLPRELNLSEGSEIRWGTKTYRICGSHNGKLQAIDENDKPTELNAAAIEEKFREGTINTSNTQQPDTPYNASSPDRQRIALEKLKKISRYERGDKKCLTRRTYYSYKAQYKFGLSAYGCGISGLIPRIRNGNTKPKTDRKSINLLKSYIFRAYLGLSDKELEKANIRDVENFGLTDSVSRESKNLHQAWADYAIEAERRKLPAVTYSSFTRAFKRISERLVTLKKEGPKAAYQKEQHYSGKHSGMAVGKYAGHVVEIDHTKIDLEAIGEESIKLSGRLWLTVAIDTFSRMILGWCFLMIPPSRASIMLTMRSILSNVGYMPTCFSVDGGSEFSSGMFQGLCARYRTDIHYRPVGKPRCGNKVERFFKTANLDLWHNMKGNTVLMVNPRSVSREFKAKNRAVWRICDVEDTFANYVKKYNETLIHSSICTTPREKHDASFSKLLSEEKRIVSDADKFRSATLPEASGNGERTVRRGALELHNLTYCSAILSRPELDKESLPVRYDPLDLTYIEFAYKGEYHRAELKGHKKNIMSVAEIREFSILESAKAALRPLLKKLRVTDKAAWLQELKIKEKTLPKQPQSPAPKNNKKENQKLEIALDDTTTDPIEMDLFED